MPTELSNTNKHTKLTVYSTSPFYRAGFCPRFSLGRCSLWTLLNLMQQTSQQLDRPSIRKGRALKPDDNEETL